MPLNELMNKLRGTGRGLILSRSTPFSIPNSLRWRLNDNAANTTVVGDNGNGTLAGGNTADVAATLLNAGAYHLDGATQYVTIPIPYIWPSARSALWTKHASNPVLSVPGSGVLYGQLCAKPGGGWYFYSGDVTGAVYSICRWESADLITWANKTQVLAPAGGGAWDTALEVASVFQKPDNSWIMLYRGFNGAVHQIGLATSADGTNFIRKNNGGINDGLFAVFGTNIDPVGVILVGARYYVWVSGAGGVHGSQNIYYSDDDFATFAAAANNPLFQARDSFCSSVWQDGAYYYALVPRDFVAGGSTLYDHAIGIYRSTSPFFTKATTEFLGYPIVNDQAYDARYLDTPSIPTTDVYRTTYGAGLTKYSAIYSSMSAAAVYTQSLARGSLPPNPCLDSIFGPLSFSFSIQFDTLVDGESVFSVGNAANDGAPRWLVCIQTTADGKVISAFTGAGYEYTNLGLAINTPYKVVVTDDLTLTKVYINGILRGTFVGRNNNLHINNLYIADGFPGTKPLDGFISDFRVYPKVLTLDEMMRLKIGI